MKQVIMVLKTSWSPVTNLWQWGPMIVFRREASPTSFGLTDNSLKNRLQQTIVSYEAI